MVEKVIFSLLGLGVHRSTGFSDIICSPPSFLFFRADPHANQCTTLRSVARKVIIIPFLCTHGKGDLRCRACGINKPQARHHVRGHLQKMHGRDSCMIWDKAQRQGVASRTGQNIIPARADWPKHVSRCPHCREEAAGGVGSRHPALPGNLLADEDCWESRFSSAFSGYHHYIHRIRGDDGARREREKISSLSSNLNNILKYYFKFRSYPARAIHKMRPLWYWLTLHGWSWVDSPLCSFDYYNY